MLLLTTSISPQDPTLLKGCLGCRLANTIRVQYLKKGYTKSILDKLFDFYDNRCMQTANK